MTDLGSLKQFLGLGIEKYESDIMISQNIYASDLLLKFNMAECKAAKCPFLSGIKLGEVDDYPLVDFSLYRQLVGILLYLTHSRPHLAYVVGFLSIYMHKPHDIHLKEANRILHYLQGTRHFKVHYVVGSLL